MSSSFFLVSRLWFFVTEIINRLVVDLRELHSLACNASFTLAFSSSNTLKTLLLLLLLLLSSSSSLLWILFFSTNSNTQFYYCFPPTLASSFILEVTSRQNNFLLFNNSVCLSSVNAATSWLILIDPSGELVRVLTRICMQKLYKQLRNKLKVHKLSSRERRHD